MPLRLPVPLRLVIFDCDGVLIDSETVVNRVIAEELTAIGWPLTTAQSQSAFLGMTLTDMRPMIEARLGPLPAGWAAHLSQRILDALQAGVPAMPGAETLLQATSALGLPWRIASNSSRAEMAIKFARTGLDRMIGTERIHSAGDMMAMGRRGKPAPDLFLAAAATEGVDPASCVVVEDSVPGTTGAVAAGMACLGYAPHGTGEALRIAGAQIVRTLGELPAMFAAAMQDAAA